MSSAARSRNWLVRSLLLGVPLVIILYIYFIALRPVAIVAAAYKGRAFNSVPGSVEVKAEYVMELKSEVGGRIAVSVLDPGRPVTKGEVLVQLDTGDVDLEIERIRNDLEAAKKKFELGSRLRAEVLISRDKLDIMERQMKVGAVAGTDFENAKRAHQQLQANKEREEVELKQAVDTLETSLKAKLRERGKMFITAPTDGVIAEISMAARAGDLIGRDNVIATLISSSRAVEAKISEENFSGIKVGQRASVRFLGYGSQTYPATVTKVLPTANAETQRYTVHLNVELPADKPLVPGLTGEVSIILGQREADAIIPRRALRGKEVYVVANGRVEQRKVEPGYVLSDAEILSGLKAGELVIVENLDTFRPGMRVRTELLK